MCAKAARQTSPGVIRSPQITEASGLAASRISPGVLWTHNDSGGRAEVFAVNQSGELLATLQLEGAKSFDWEDIAVTSSGQAGGAGEGTNSIYVGDIGDNKLRRDFVTVYRFDEPTVSSQPSNKSPLTLRGRAERHDFVYPDGPRDAEAMFVDPSDDMVYIIDKNWLLDGTAGVYQAPIPAVTGTQPKGDPVKMTKVGTLELPEGSLITAADLSPDGSAIAVRAYGAEYLFARKSGQSIIDALGTKPCKGPAVPEAQGEAITFASDSASYLTVAEGAQPPLHRVTPSAD